MTDSPSRNPSFPRKRESKFTNRPNLDPASVSRLDGTGRKAALATICVTTAATTATTNLDSRLRGNDDSEFQGII